MPAGKSAAACAQLLLLCRISSVGLICLLSITRLTAAASTPAELYDVLQLTAARLNDANTPVAALHHAWAICTTAVELCWPAAVLPMS
jgi:hypothetical protein